MSEFFINRPVFAWVIAIFITLIGLLAVHFLPISQYPSVAPPSVSISASYPGASAETIESAVTSLIEEQMNGLDGLMYMSSTSESAGTATITLTFEPGVDPDIAEVQIQNKLQQAMPRLPQEVSQGGVKVFKSTKNFLMFFLLSSTDGKMDEVALGNYVVANVLDPISRVQGVGEANLFGTQYAMRIWLHPEKMTGYRLSVQDVVNAIRSQNIQVAGGEFGGLPAVKGQRLNATISVQSRFKSPEEFRNIVLRAQPDGSTVYLRDIADVSLGGDSYALKARLNGHAAVGVGIKPTPTANALATGDAVKAKVKELSKFFPNAVRYDIPYDTTTFIKISIEEVIKTLLEAIVLVFLVMYLFLQNFRATLIPTLVVPVALMGTFGVMAVFGFSINTLTLFGMVLAIGLLVDDAIVVIENVERLMSEEGISPREATRKAMKQITNALIGISLVLTAVFIPMAFFGGSVGAIYRQFSIALVASMLFSVFLALTLTPVLCATLLKPIQANQHAEKKGFLGWFNKSFQHQSNNYQGVVARILKKTTFYMLMYGAIIAVVALLFWRIPGSFLPDEDQGYMYGMVQLPPGSTQEQTLGVLKRVENYFLTQEKQTVQNVISVAGYSFFGSAQNGALLFIQLKDFKDRATKDGSVFNLYDRSMAAFSKIKEGIALPINLPPIREMGTSNGFDMQLQDRAGLGHAQLIQARNRLLGMAAKSPLLQGVRAQGLEDTAQYKVDIDTVKASVLGLDLTEVNNTLSAAFGSLYVNDFNREGRIQRVVLQAGAEDRMLPKDINALYVRNKQGDMVPFSSFATGRWIYGSPRLEHYNGNLSVEIVGGPAPGKSTGEAMQEMERLVSQLPNGIGLEWTGLSYEEQLSGSQAPALFAISIIFVFLCLAALYESWSIPFSVMLVVPLGILGALLAASLRGLPNDVYFKVGLLTTIGLATKNAILIVEFAQDLQAQGKSLIEATLESVRLRLRPIIMTSLAFLLGVLPLVFSRGAGSSSQHAIGTGVAGGIIAATLLAIFFVPVFFVVIRKRFPGSERQREFCLHGHAHEVIEEKAQKPEQGDGNA